MLTPLLSGSNPLRRNLLSLQNWDLVYKLLYRKAEYRENAITQYDSATHKVKKVMKNRSASFVEPLMLSISERI